MVWLIEQEGGFRSVYSDSLSSVGLLSELIGLVAGALAITPSAAFCSRDLATLCIWIVPHTTLHA